MKKILLSLVVLLGILSQTTLADTYVSGDQWGTWNLAGSPYILTGDVTVPDGNTLTIESGVEVQINNINYYLRVYGTLAASGVNFTGSHVWIYIYDGGTANLSSCSMVGHFAFFAGSSGTVDNCTGSWDLNVYDSAVTVKWCDLDKIYVNSCNPSIFGNNFFGSAHLYASGDPCSTVTAENNWWGSADPCEIKNKITHYVDDSGRPLVDFEPFRPHPFGTNVIYMDFAGYTPPGGYGTAEEIASYVKQSVVSKFAAESTSFSTSFDGPITKTGVTSHVIFGGTSPDPNKLGEASTDPGNQNWTDIA